MPSTERPESILSHGERDVAGHLRANPDASNAEIAEARGVPEEAVERSIVRLRDKTVRALQTLSESPFTAEIANDLDDETRRRVLRALDDRED